jgi:hypothetical protein
MAAAATKRRRRSWTRLTAMAATRLRHASAIVQNRAGTRSPSKPGSRMSHAYGACSSIGRFITVGSGPRASTHITNAAER